jgi:hypothetical protein
MKNPQQRMRKISRKPTHLFSRTMPWWGADGVNSVRLHLLVRISKCGADPTPGSQIQGSHISIDGNPGDIEVFRNVLNSSPPSKPELHVDAVGVSFTGWLSHLRRAGTRCQ